MSTYLYKTLNACKRISTLVRLETWGSTIYDGGPYHQASDNQMYCVAAHLVCLDYREQGE